MFALTTDPPYVAIGAAVGVAVFLLVVAAAAGLIKCRKRTKETDGLFKYNNIWIIYKDSI